MKEIRIIKKVSMIILILVLNLLIHTNCTKNININDFYKSKNSFPKKAAVVWTMVNVNVGAQGDAHVIQVREGKTILIDAGFANIAEKHLIPFLFKNNIKNFDIVFISHPHKDHYGGILPLLKAGIKIKKIYFNIPDKRLCDHEIPWGCDYNDILECHKILKFYGVPIKTAQAGQRFSLGNRATIRILYAFNGVNTPVGRTDINDTSLIMKLEYSGYSFLFSGDLNKKLGDYLAKYAYDIQADVLKVPHHGTEGLAPNHFFDKVNPKCALVPSPANLWFSKRSSRPRNYFKKKNIPVFVNGICGNVKVEIKDGKLEVTPENGEVNFCIQAVHNVGRIKAQKHKKYDRN